MLDTNTSWKEGFDCSGVDFFIGVATDSVTDGGAAMDGAAMDGAAMDGAATDGVAVTAVKDEYVNEIVV